MIKKTKLIMLAGAVVAGIGALCVFGRKVKHTDDEDEMGINEIFSNCKEMFDEVPVATLNAVYKNAEKLYTALGHMYYLGYDKDGDFIKAKVIDDEDDTYVQIYYIDGKVQWRLAIC